MVKKIVVQLVSSDSAVQEMIKGLGYKKVSCHWVSQLLADRQKRTHLGVWSQLLHQHTAESSDFLLNILTSNESWFHHFDTKEK
jgi:hypothetical protein